MACDSNLVSRDDLYKAKRQTQFIADVGTGGPNETVTNPDSGVIVPTLVEAIRRVGFEVPVLYETGLNITSVTQTVYYNNDVYHAINVPFVTSGTFETDNFVLLRGLTNNDVPALLAQLLGIGASLYAGDAGAGVEIGDVIPNGTSHIIVSDEVYSLDTKVTRGVSELTLHTSGFLETVVTSSGTTTVTPIVSSGFFEFNGSDETEKLQYLCKSGASYTFPPGKTLNVSGTMSLEKGSNINGSWCNLVVAGNHRVFDIKEGRLENFDVDGQNLSHSSYPCFFNQGFSGAQLGPMRWRNFKGDIGTFQTYPVTIPLYGVYDFMVERQEFYTIQQEDDGSVTGAGFVGGVYLYGTVADSSVYDKSTGTVGDVYGNDIKSVRTSGVAVQDSDLVRVYAEDPSLGYFRNIKIGDIHAVDVAKRAAKIGAKGITLGSIISENKNLTDPVFAAVEILSTGNETTINDVKIIGAHDRGYYCAASTCSANNIIDFYGCTVGAVLLGGSGGNSRYTTVHSVTGELTNPLGVACYFYGAEDCKVENVTGNHSVAVKTFSAHSGLVSTIGTLSALGQILASDGEVVVLNWVTDYSKAVTGLASTVQLTAVFSCPNMRVKVDGRVLINIGGNSSVTTLHGEIHRVSSANGNENNHSVISSAGAAGGLVKGSIRVRVDASVAGTPTGAAGKTLVYFSGVSLELTELVIDCVATIRGATGLLLWVNECPGVLTLVSIHSQFFGTVPATLTGDLNINLLEHRVNNSTVTFSTAANLFLYAARPSATYTGLSNAPVRRDSNR